MVETEGLYNPFVLPALQRAGYVGSWPHPEIHDARLDYSQRERSAGADDLMIKPSSATISVGTALDFGGIGKGYLLDQLADLLDTKHVKDYWLSLGGDIICNGFDSEDKPWKIGLASAEQPDTTAASITNTNGQKMAIATSGITKRGRDGWHHIIDPRTGLSAKTDILAASLGLQNATAADVYATCLIVLSSKAAETFMNTRNITDVLLQVRHTGQVELKRYGAVA